jgi:hypothetical protein
MFSRPRSSMRLAPQNLCSRYALCGLSLTVAAAAWLAPSSASAQEPPPNCPPGSWFCAEAPPPPKTAPAPAVAPPGKGELEPLPPAEPLPPPNPPPPPVVVYRPGPPGPPPPPPVVIYQPSPTVILRPPPPPPPPYYYYRPRTKPARISEWGINTRFEGAPNGSGSRSTRAMLGAGFGVRYRPVPAFAVEAGFDFLSGNDYNDDPRRETEFSVNALVFLNPRSRVQFYLLAGLGGSWADVNTGYNNNYYNGYDFGTSHYTYFGGQAGGGLEFRVSKHFAMNLDARAFLRTRTDSGASSQPEFVSSTGQTTNTSDGCLITAGMTFYF